MANAALITVAPDLAARNAWLEERCARLEEALTQARDALVNFDALLTGELGSDWSERYGADYETYTVASEAARAALATPA